MLQAHVSEQNRIMSLKEQEKVDQDKNNEFAATMLFLNKVDLFKRLPRDVHPLLAASVQVVDFKVGEEIIKQGDAGSEFFVIRMGEAGVYIAPDGGERQQVAMLKQGDYFGERALLRDEPRTATIIAESWISTLRITREKFQGLNLHEKLQFAKRKAVAGGHTKAKTINVKASSPKTAEERELITKALRDNENLTTMVTLDDTCINSLIEVAWQQSVSNSTMLIKELDTNADFFYIVQEGSFDIFMSEKLTNAQPVSAEHASISRGESKKITTVNKGGSFGELALLYSAPRAATVTAREDAVVWVIDRQNFKRTLMQNSQDNIAEYMKYLSNVDILSSLLHEEKKALAQALDEKHFSCGEVILEQGQPGSTFYILIEGEVTVLTNGVEQTKLHGSFDCGQVFGERALLTNEPRAATIKVTSDSAKALAIDKGSFDLLLGPLENILAASSREVELGQTASMLVGKAGQVTDRWRSSRKIKMESLETLGLLGCGGFGVVELVKHRDSGETYALKGLSKGYVVKSDMQDSVMNEKNIMLMCNSPFIIRLHATYNSSQSLYFLMEVAMGGELYATYNCKGLHGSEKHARFYSAGVVLAFEHLHERHVIYRDLKPENVLLDNEGQPKLTDMGLAKFVIGRTYTTCGTPDYFAPEVIASTGHRCAVDWWTLGILIFELLTGHPPFESATPMQIYGKVMKGIGKVQFPSKVGPTAVDLIKRILKKDPSERLPMRSGGSTNLRSHKWFAQFDWDAMLVGKVVPPYQPVVKNNEDIANFDANEEDKPTQLPYEDDGTGWDGEFES